METENGQADWRFSVPAIHASVLQGRAKDHWQELRSLPMETLVIRGENSKELSRETYQRMLLANPRMKGVEIANAGHWVHADKPDDFLRAIRQFAGLP